MMIQKTNSKKYFEPNAAPEEVQKQQSAKRKIIMRFENEEAVRLFTKKTGIQLFRNRLNKINFPINNVLDM